MKKNSRLIVIVLPLLFAILACTCGLPTSLPDIQIPSLQTRAASAGTSSEYRPGKGPNVASVDNTKSFLDKNPDTSLLEELAQEQYTSEELSQPDKTYAFNIQLTGEQPLVMLNGWCATSQKILDDNFKHISLDFKINGTSIDPKYISAIEHEDATSNLFCRSFFVLLSGWPKGKTELTIAVTFDAKINDGMGDYPKGTHYYKYIVTY